MIKNVQFTNFKRFEFSEPLEVPRFVVLVGNNSAGKTNFCKDGISRILSHP
jgi:AAA15 family ATPase/GTPase